MVRIECGGWLVGEAYPRDAVEEGEKRGTGVCGDSPCDKVPITIDMCLYVYIYVLIQRNGSIPYPVATPDVAPGSIDISDLRVMHIE